MKIWCDVRFFEDQTPFSEFILDFLGQIIVTKADATFFLYSHQNIAASWGNIIVKKIKNKRGRFIDDIKLAKILKKDELDIFISFDHFKPSFYRGETLQIVESLAHVFYSDDFKSSLKKTWYMYTYQKNFKNAKKIICFEESTKDDINERFNIEEEKIAVISPYFVFNWLKKASEVVKIDIKSKHNLGMDYLVYDSGYGVDKNLERLIDVMGRIRESWNDIALFIIWNDEGETDLEMRKMVLDMSLNDRVFFLSNVKKEEEPFLYQQSIWVVYPGMYESFPFTLSKALFFNVPIISSHLVSVKNIFWDEIHYFNPVSKVDMTKTLLEFIRTNHKIHYQEIIKKYSQEQNMDPLKKVLFS